MAVRMSMQLGCLELRPPFFPLRDADDPYRPVARWRRLDKTTARVGPLEMKSWGRRELYGLHS
jgi:hypothetical protein